MLTRSYAQDHTEQQISLRVLLSNLPHCEEGYLISLGLEFLVAALSNLSERNNKNFKDTAYLTTKIKVWNGSFSKWLK